MAFSMSADAKKDTQSTRKRRAGAVDITRVMSAGGSVTDAVRVRRSETIPMTSGCLMRFANWGL